MGIKTRTGQNSWTSQTTISARKFDDVPNRSHVPSCRERHAMESTAHLVSDYRVLYKPASSKGRGISPGPNSQDHLLRYLISLVLGIVHYSALDICKSLVKALTPLGCFGHLNPKFVENVR
jgi:hypothetical protein